MQTGTVVTLVEGRGFGFVSPDEGGKDLFFHCSELSDDLEFDATLEQRRVCFDIIQGARPRAVNVRAAD